MKKKKQKPENNANETTKSKPANCTVMTCNK